MPAKKSALVSTLRLLHSASAGHFYALLAGIAWKCLQPVAMIVAIGHLIGAVSAGESGRLIAILAIVCGIFLVDMCVGSIMESLTGDFGWRISRTVGRRMLTLSHQSRTLHHLHDAAISDLVALVRTRLSGFVPQRLVTLLSTVVSTRVSALVVAVLLFQYAWWAPLAIGAAAFVTRALIMAHVSAYERALQLSAPQMRRAGYFRDLAVTAEPAKELRIFGLGDWAVEEFRTLYALGLNESGQDLRKTRWLMAGAILAQLFAFALVGASLALSGIEGALGVGAIATYIQAAWRMLGIAEGPTMEQEFQRLAILPKSIAELEVMLGDVAGSNGCARTGGGARNPKIEFASVSFSYPDSGKEILKDFCVSIAAGETVAIVGANGAGKSTIVNLLAGLYEPRQGAVLIDGVDVRDVSRAAAKSRLAVVFQTFCRWPLSLRENVRLGLKPGAGDDAKILATLDKVGMRSLPAGLPNGLDTVLSKGFTGGVDLSGGQWQRVALARALMAIDDGAEILVMDEPTSHMDIRAEEEFWNVLLKERSGATTILISHRFSTIRRADRIVVVEQGRVIEDGSHQALMALNGVYARQFLLQAQTLNLDETKEGVS